MNKLPVLLLLLPGCALGEANVLDVSLAQGDAASEDCVTFDDCPAPSGGGTDASSTLGTGGVSTAGTAAGGGNSASAEGGSYANAGGSFAEGGSSTHAGGSFAGGGSSASTGGTFAEPLMGGSTNLGAGGSE